MRMYLLPCLSFAVAVLTLAACLPQAVRGQDAAKPAKPIPVILDTDIGDDIDDTWALGLLLKSPELDVKLVLGDYGKPLYRAKILARFLQEAGRADIPVGLGLGDASNASGPQAEWVRDYDLASYPGKVHKDGVGALIDTIMQSSEPVTLIAIGPLPNVAAALEREPKIAQRARFVGMHGSVRRGYGGSSEISAEWNVRADAKSCAKALSAPWDVTITPLDTCGLVNLSGARYASVRDSKDKIAVAVIENYRMWSTHKDKNNDAAESRSSTLFDTVAVYLAIEQDLCKMEELGIRVTDDGRTLIDESAKTMNVATQWTSLDDYRDWLVKRLTASASQR